MLSIRTASRYDCSTIEVSSKAKIRRVEIDFRWKNEWLKWLPEACIDAEIVWVKIDYHRILDMKLRWRSHQLTTTRGFSYEAKIWGYTSDYLQPEKISCSLSYQTDTGWVKSDHWKSKLTTVSPEILIIRGFEKKESQEIGGVLIDSVDSRHSLAAKIGRVDIDYLRLLYNEDCRSRNDYRDQWVVISNRLSVSVQFEITVGKRES
jgi:hypothetical protein